MRNLLLVSISAICIFLFTRCVVVAGLAYAIEEGDGGRQAREMRRNNRAFDRDGWYEFKHHFNSDSLNAYYVRKDSLNLSDFYLSEEYNYVEKNMRLRSELDTFNFFSRKLQGDYIECSLYRNALVLPSGKEKKEIKDAYHCYIDLGTNEVASCFFTKKSIFIPYILIKNEEIIAKPKPYLPLLPLAEYKKSLPTTQQVSGYNHVIHIGKDYLLVDTSQRFQQFHAALTRNYFRTSKITEIDTSHYEVNLRIQYNFYRNGENINYCRFQFMKFNSVNYSYPDKYYNSGGASERYFNPEKKLIYKEKLDQLFKQLAKEHPELKKRKK